MVKVTRYRALGGVCAKGGVGHALAACRRHRGKKRPKQSYLSETSGGLWAAFDGRIDNRRELEAALGLRPRAFADATLVGGAYQKWGFGAANRIEGDFALLVWDPHQHLLYAARDPFGVRPLFYVSSKGRMYFSSSVEALLTTAPSTWELDASSILGGVLFEQPDLEATYFRGIRRVPGGHYLVATARGIKVERYFYPPASEQPLSSLADCDRECRDLLLQSVRRRMTASEPVAAQLSGGLDSASIVCLGDRIASDSGGAFHPISAAFDGFDCDESSYVKHIQAEISAKVRWYSGAGLAFNELDADVWSSPWRNPQSGVHVHGFELAQSLNARIVLSGIGADELLFERGLYVALAQKRRVGLLFGETVGLPGLYSSRSPRFFLREACLFAMPTVRQALRSLRARVRPPPRPSWLGPRMQGAWSQWTSPVPGPDDGFGFTMASELGRANWRWLTRPTFQWLLELLELEAARHGIELRFPFLDRRLVEFVLSLPIEARLPRGRMKIVLRRAMSGILPPSIERRLNKTHFADNVIHGVRQAFPLMERTLARGRWVSSPFVKRSSVIDQFQKLDGSTDWSDFRTVWDLVMVERWMRSLIACGHYG